MNLQCYKEVIPLDLLQALTGLRVFTKVAKYFKHQFPLNGYWFYSVPLTSELDHDSL